ncbi:MAG: hypothetical protein ABI843_14635 [Dokdonella sp.]
MLDEASRARLAEMGIDVYLPRAQPGRAAAQPEPTQSQAASSSATSMQAPTARVLLLTEAPSARARALAADVVRALKFARIEAAEAAAADAAGIAIASGLVLFGDALARKVGAVLPAQRQREIGWVVTDELALLARDVKGKRALWSELKRLVRELANKPGI